MSLLTTLVFVQEQNELSHHGAIFGNFANATQYVFRGGVENDALTFQASLGYALKNGIYVDYWEAYS